MIQDKVIMVGFCKVSDEQLDSMTSESVRFEVLTASSMKTTVFWVVYQHFRGAYCLHHQGDTSRTSVNFYQTIRHNNPEDSHLHTRRREDMKSNPVRLYV
jgi:hypothetical protein